MATMNDIDLYDFDYEFPPKPRKTYGKSRTTKAPPATLRSVKSEIPTVATSPSPPASPEPKPQPRPRIVASSSKIKPQTKRYGRAPNARLPEETQSQPLPSAAEIVPQEDDPKPKKRKLVRAQSDKKEKAAVSYSTPDSSPSEAQPPVKRRQEEIPRSIPAIKPAKVRSTPEKDTKPKNAVSADMPFSAKTSRALDNLSLGPDAVAKPKQSIPLRLSQARPISSKPLVKKRRLIDALAAQAESSSSSSEDEDESQETTVSRRKASPELLSSSPPPSSVPPKHRTVRPVHSAKKAGPKFTYSQKRTMLAEEDDIFPGGGLGVIAEEPSNGPLFNFALPKTSRVNAFSFMDEDDETVNTGAVRSIHELRQAGANSRFADEMDDILDRIGAPSAKPSTLRRGALLELAEKIKEKDFRQQFRNHSNSSGVFKSLGEETDTVCAYCLVAIIATLLATSVSAHLVQEVLDSGLASLLGRILGETTDISLLVKDRKQNVSKNGQSTLGIIKSSFLGLPIWEPIAPSSLSPRTFSLKCLDLIMRQSSYSSSEADIFTPEVTDRLFSVLSTGASNEQSWDFPANQASTDFYLALYVIEGHSISAMQSRMGERWTSRYVPIVADVLETALQRPADKTNDLESLALRITINVTNNNADACQMLVEKGLLRRLAESSCTAFDLSLNSIKVDAFLPKVHESLIMMLGVMINFCVYYPPASKSLEEKGSAANSPLNRLIRVFADNHAKTADADSIQKTQLNVALGYLSILLGYLCLSQSILERFAAVHPKKTLLPLLDSINEFIDLHHKMAKAQQEGESDFAALGRLKNLVAQLEDKLGQ